MNDETSTAILAYAALLGLDRDDIDPLLIQETSRLLDALRLAAASDLGETPLPTAFTSKQA
jgi:hypothetical protein